MIELDWPDLSLSSVQILQGWHSDTMVQILQEWVRGISDSARVLTWVPGGASLCIAFHRGARKRIWMLSSWGRYWYIVELPSSFDSRYSQSHSWSETLMLTEGFGSQSSRTWQLAYLYGEIWDSGVGSMYLWLNVDFTVVLLSLRSDVVMIRVIQFTGATFFHRLIWDLGIRLTGGLQSGTLLHSSARIVFSIGFKVNYRLIWDPGINCLRASNLKEGRLVMSLFWGH